MLPKKVRVFYHILCEKLLIQLSRSRCLCISATFRDYDKKIVHVTSWQTCWRYINTKEYFTIAIVGSSQRGQALLSALSHEIDCKRRIWHASYYPSTMAMGLL